MVQIELAKVLVVLVDHDDGMISGKFHSCGSSLLHPCKVLVSRTAVIFAVLSCLYQDDQLRECYKLRNCSTPWWHCSGSTSCSIFISSEPCCGGTHHLYSNTSFQKIIHQGCSSCLAKSSPV